ncbi:C39 family peptidase [Candidatus Roizmanbacteria bacterium]|nr:C39 family peptidase [Candidatus Roizmanbacteria bacterium]
MKKTFLLILILILAGGLFLVFKKDPEIVIRQPAYDNITSAPSPLPTPVQTTYLLKPIPPKKILNNDYHVFQTFNNCGPAALSMALSYYGINKGQEELGVDLRPYQNSQGDNDDKSVTLDELEEKSKEFGFIPYHRPNGNADLIKLFINYEIPVITRTLLTADQDIGHYRVVKGYDNETNEFIQDDSLQGKNLKYSYEEFDILWKQFNYEYLALVPPEKQKIAESILKEDKNEKIAWENAVQKARDQLENNPDDLYASFNLSVALYNIGNYQESVLEFEKVENVLAFRTLWYQIEPIKAYFELGNYQKVFELTDKIFNNQNRAFSELYILRGEIYNKQGNSEAAKNEFEKALFYNKNLKSFPN